MRDGLYKVQFDTQRGTGSGVVFLQGGKLRGGDSRIYYVGTYDENGGQFSARVTTDQHTDVPGMSSVFGVDRSNINLRGIGTVDSAEMKGTAAEAPGISFRAVLTRIAD
jgi:hypothetical protein